MLGDTWCIFFPSIVKSESHLTRQWASSVPSIFLGQWSRSNKRLFLCSIHSMNVVEAHRSFLWVFFGITPFDFNANSSSVVGFGNLELLSPVLVFCHFFSGWQSSLSSKSVHSPIPSQKFPWFVSSSREREETWCSLTNYVKQYSHYTHSLAIATHKTARSTKYKNKVCNWHSLAS